MKFFLQILFLVLTWFTNLNATPVCTKVVLPTYEFSFSKTENVKEKSIVKIGDQNFVRSNIEEDNFCNPFSIYSETFAFLSCEIEGKNKHLLIFKKQDKKDQIAIVKINFEKWIFVGNRAHEVEVVGVNGAVRHANWVEVTDITNKVLAKKPHVLRMDINANNTGFQGCHSKIALDDYLANNPTATFEFRNKVLGGSNNGVYEANPVIKLQNGTELVKTNNAGKSTFFPDTWNEAKVLDEVEYAISNNQGKIPTKPNGNEYFGLSRDGKVEIHFYYNTNGTISSYFPVKQ
jgi:hypothetical protein